MTYALCFNCGQTKFGALVPCRECGAAASGNMDLDIAFSDHVLALESIEAFGNVIKEICKQSDDVDINFSAFIRYVSLCHSGVLKVELPEETTRACDALLARISLASFKLVRSPASQQFLDEQARERDDHA